MRNFDLPGRSPVYSRNAMVATSHPSSTAAALDVLRAGGNAMDAAVAACAVQCIVEPQSTGIGGDCFCLFAANGSDEIIAFNGSGRAPAAASAAWYAHSGIESIERQSPHAVTVPGAVDAWDQLIRDHGRLELGQVLSPAIRIAREGYAVTPRVAVDFAGQRDLLARDPAAAAVFLRAGRTPGVGEIHSQPLLAATLEKIARNGRDAFYRGPVAESIVGYLRERGGLHSMADFAAARGEYVIPIATDYRDFRVFECPPNGQGVIALLLLNMLSHRCGQENDPLDPQRLHLEIEAGRLAYRDRSLWVGDPVGTNLPVEQLLSDDYARELFAEIDPQRALTALPPSSLANHEDTVYISVVDSERNACSFINSLFHSFGSVQMAPETGVMLHNRGQGFSLQEGHPNAIAAGKRPMHTIIPGMVTQGGQCVMPFGVMGGHYQAYGHMQFLSRMLELDLDIQQAQDLPRLFPDPGGPVQVESGVPGAVCDTLRAMGHQLTPAAKPLGGSQAVFIDWETNTLIGGSDPRKDGCAFGY